MTVAPIEPLLFAGPRGGSFGGRHLAATRKVRGPRYELEKHRPLFASAFLSPKRATREVVVRLGYGEPRAEKFIRRKLKMLGSANYVCTVEMEFDKQTVADVYGITDEHGGWYIKFFVDNGQVVVCSFHEPEHDLRCADGTVVRGGKGS